MPATWRPMGFGWRPAYDFCLEVPCADLRVVDVPFAVHAAWYYNDERRVMGLLDRALGRWIRGAADGGGW